MGRLNHLCHLPSIAAAPLILNGKHAIMMNFRYIKNSAVPGCGWICSRNPLDPFFGDFHA
jgi:hypothetical protein